MYQARTATGKVVSLWQYPVKSMMGEELNSSYATERGLIGDRAYALIDKKTGKVAKSKNKAVPIATKVNIDFTIKRKVNHTVTPP